MSSLEYALQKAREIPYVRKQYRLYAVITDRKGRIIAESSNSYTCTHPKQYYAAKRVGRPFKQYLHAEAATLIKSRGKGCKLYVARVLSDGTAANAKLCPVCEEMVRLHGGIKSIEYTA